MFGGRRQADGSGRGIAYPAGTGFGDPNTPPVHTRLVFAPICPVFTPVVTTVSRICSNPVSGPPTVEMPQAVPALLSVSSATESVVVAANASVLPARVSAARRPVAILALMASQVLSWICGENDKRRAI